MPHEAPATAPETPEITPEIRDKAKILIKRRFQYIERPDDTFKLLAQMGLERLAQDIARSPETYEDRRIRELPSETGDKLDPLDILRKELQLPALPQVFLELQQAINAPNTSADDLARIISQDPSLTAFLLRMVNSAFYSLPIQIDTITRAVTVVGVNQLTTLAVGTSVLSLFKDIPPEMLNMERFWKHSITVGIIARKLCKLTGQGDPERSFVAGLLHDIGQLAMLKAVPERVGAVINHGQANQTMLFNSEKELLGFDHATLGGMLLRKWNFPYVLVAAVLEHHVPKKNQKEAEPRLVHCAETIATGLGIGSSGEFFTQPPDMVVWESLDMDQDKLEHLVEGLDEELEEAFSILVT